MPASRPGPQQVKLLAISSCARLFALRVPNFLHGASTFLVFKCSRTPRTSLARSILAGCYGGGFFRLGRFFLFAESESVHGEENETDETC